MEATTSIGLISDTHYQDRLFDLPQNLADLWSDIDLILHAGDVGELDVLDRLSEIAPVIAVHGNDEPDYVRRELPLQQIIGVNGVRILLWHSHYPDPIEENFNRKGVWGPKLGRIARRGREVSARVVVYGHTHIPLISNQEGILLINPGALAAGSYFTRQTALSVGRLQIHANGEIDFMHFDLATGQGKEFKTADGDDDFNLLADQYQEWIVEPGLIPIISRLRKITYENVRAVVCAIVPLYRRCLSDGLMQREDLVEAIQSSERITPLDKRNALHAIENA